MDSRFAADRRTTSAVATVQGESNEVCKDCVRRFLRNLVYCFRKIHGNYVLLRVRKFNYTG